MSILLPAQAASQLATLFILIAVARWYAAPFLAVWGRAEALIPLLWVNVFRYVALQIFAAQREGFPISMGGATEIVIGDVAGAVIAFAAIILLRRRLRAGIALSWVLAVETVIDTFLNIRGGVEEHLMGAATGVTWMILAFYVPAIIVSIGLLIWQLVTRRGEALDATEASAVLPMNAVPAQRFA
jgi:hypothetical protein